MLPEFGKILHVYIPISKNKKLGEGKLSFPQDSQAGSKGLARIPVHNPGSSQAMKPCFTEGFQLAYTAHHQRKQR